jgi:cytochrome c556
MRLTVRTIAILVAGTALAVSGGTLSAADPGPAEIIKARQEKLKDLGEQMKTIGGQAKSGTLDRAVMAEAAKKAVAYTKDLPSWFPKGTGPEVGVKTGAKPEIWAQPDDFNAAAEKLPPEAEKLAEVVATGDTPTIFAQLQATGKTCQACHKEFRVKDKEE